MATARIHCVICQKERSTFKCGGCSQEYCYNHLIEHQQKMSKDFDEIELNRDLLRQAFYEYTSDSCKHVLIEQINRWENNSIEQIQQAAEEARQTVLQHTSGHVRELEKKLDKLTEQLRQQRGENDFFETDLLRWNEQLTQLKKELTEPVNINLRQDTTPLINKILVEITAG